MKVESVAIFCMELSLVSFGLSMCQNVRLVGQVDGSDDHNYYHHHPHKCDDLIGITKKRGTPKTDVACCTVPLGNLQQCF